jgi:pyruvate,water dikinase
MFSVYESKNIQSDNTYELDIGIPLEIYVIDLGGGLITNGTVNNKVGKEHIISTPFLALIDGMTTPGVRWSGHLSLDMRGFASLVFGNIVDVHRSETPLGSRNYALVSENYVNFFSRLGYHFSRLDAFASDEINRNYINFNFRGGAADHIRKMRRARAVQRILRHYNFSATLSEDNVIASIRKIPQEEVFSLLKELGRLMGAVRNTDVTMLSDEHVNIFVQGFIEGDPAPALRYINNG